jgi:hypothetical protein
VGNPATLHTVEGSPTGNNFFRIQGPNGIDVQTNLFAVSGKVFDLATFAPPVTANPLTPVAVADAAQTLAGVALTINVLANDTINNVTVNPANVTVTPLPTGTAGSVVVNALTKVVTYTPAAGFAGIDTFAYNVTETATGLTSNNALVTVTVTAPPDVVTLKRARLDLQRLALEVEGESTTPGSILTIHAGATAAGPVLGTALADASGLWRFRGRVTSNLTSISITSSNNGLLLNQAVQAR